MNSRSRKYDDKVEVPGHELLAFLLFTGSNYGTFTI